MEKDFYSWEVNYKLNKKWEGKLGGVWFTYRDTQPLGRFGGGWNWSLGIDVGTYGTVKVNLLIAELSFWFNPLKEYLIRKKVKV